MSFRSKGPKGYCVKSSKFTDDPDVLYRSSAVGSNGNLFSSFQWDAANEATNVLFDLFFQPGVTSVLMTVTFDCRTREFTFALPHCIWTPDAARKGWDGCIYGNRPPGTSRSTLTLTPITHVPLPPVTALDLMGTSLPAVTYTEPSVTAAGRKWGDGHVTLMKAYDDGESERGIQFTSTGPSSSGALMDLGHTESFDVLVHKFQDGEIPTQDDLLTRTIGPIRGLTNRPSPPPFLDALLLHGTSSGVECSADFTPIDSPTVRVLIYNKGALVAQQSGVPAQLGQPLLTLPDWPLSLGKLGQATPCRRGTIKLGGILLGGGGGLAPGAKDAQIVMGDEFRILAELAPGAPHPDYYTGFEFIASDGPTWQVSGLQRVLACPAPTALSITPSSAGITLTWPAEAYRLQGAENVTGPWFDLPPASPVSLAPSYPARFFRLSCD